MRNGTKKPVAIVCSDLHLSDKCPPARSCEPSWIAAMERSLQNMFNKAEDLNIPVIIAGDIFDKWNSSAELINMCLSIWPIDIEVYACPGQHDLPQHSYELLEKSAYTTLVKSNLIKTMESSISGNICFQFAGYNEKLLFPDPNFKFNIGIVHRYCWTGYYKHNEAPVENELGKGSQFGDFEGYDLIIAGDNHKGFQWKNVFNCGTFMRRNIDEFDYIPRFGIIYSDLSIESVSNLHHEEKMYSPLDTPSYSDKTDFTDLSKYLQSVQGEDSLDYIKVINKLVHKLKKAGELTEEAKNILLGVCDECSR